MNIVTLDKHINKWPCSCETNCSNEDSN